MQISWVEYIAGTEGGLSVLRTFRIMRIFKLVRFMPEMQVTLTHGSTIALKYCDQVQISVVANSISGLGAFMVILLLVIFIWAVLGMYLFGTAETDTVRPNFDSFVSAMTAVFTLVTGEDWNQMM